MLNRFLNKKENILSLSILVLILCSVFGPFKYQDLHYHQFADLRNWLPVPNTSDVLTNLFFLIFGIFGFIQIRNWLPTAENSTTRHMLKLFYFGFIVTTFASGYYHWSPNHQSLFVDRLGMSVAFAGLLGLGVDLHMSSRRSLLFAVIFLLFGVGADGYWLYTENILPWALLQVYGLVFLFSLFFLGRKNQNQLKINWLAIIAVYFLAKVFESNDHMVFNFTHELISGHSVKHILASLAAIPVLYAVYDKAKNVDN